MQGGFYKIYLNWKILKKITTCLPSSKAPESKTKKFEYIFLQFECIFLHWFMIFSLNIVLKKYEKWFPFQKDIQMFVKKEGSKTLTPFTNLI